ncbi:SAM-dependent methyltransferase [Streptomyces thermocoprophilus]
MARLLCRVDEALGRPGTLDFVDMAAGRGELAAGVLRALPDEVAARTRAYAVEFADRPESLDGRIEWRPEPPRGITGLLFANEWLDNVPLDVVETDAAGVPRLVLVRRDGSERLGAPVAEVSDADARWLEEWWPLGGEEGLRAEIGLPRDEAWASAVACVERGAGGGRGLRPHGRHPPSVRHPDRLLRGPGDGARAGRDVRHHGARRPGLVRGVRRACTGAPGRAPPASAGRPARPRGHRGAPPLALASTDPAGYVRALAGAGEAAELTAEGGLGDFWWLVQPVGAADPIAEV